MITHKKDKIRALRRKLSVRARLKKGTATCPRVSVFRSLKHMYAQMIDDVNKVTLVSSSTLTLSKNVSGDKKKHAYEVGLALAQSAKAKGLERAFLDRGNARYMGRVASFADGLREGGIAI